MTQKSVFTITIPVKSWKLLMGSIKILLGIWLYIQLYHTSSVVVMTIRFWCSIGTKTGKEWIHTMIMSTMLCSWLSTPKMSTCLHQPPSIRLSKFGQLRPPRAMPTSVFLVTRQESIVLISVMIMRDPIWCPVATMAKSKYGTTKQSSASTRSIKDTRTMWQQSLSTPTSQSYSQRVKMTSSIFGTLSPTEVNSNWTTAWSVYGLSMLYHRLTTLPWASMRPQ